MVPSLEPCHTTLSFSITERHWDMLSIKIELDSIGISTLVVIKLKSEAGSERGILQETLAALGNVVDKSVVSALNTRHVECH